MTKIKELLVTVRWTNCGGGEKVKFLAMKRDCTKTQPRRGEEDDAKTQTYALL